MTDAAAVLSSCRGTGTPISWTGSGIPMGWWFLESRGDGPRTDDCVGFFELQFFYFFLFFIEIIFH